MSTSAIIPCLITGLVGMVAMGHGVAAEPAAIEIVIDDQHPLQSLPEFYDGNNFVALWNDVGASPQVIKGFSQLGAKLLRFPGGVPCQWYDWENPLDSGFTKITPLEAWALAQAGGSRMVFQTTTVANQGKRTGGDGGAMTFDNSPEKVVRWMKWAKENKVEVAFWEIGNEPEMDAPKSAHPNHESWQTEAQQGIYDYYNPIYERQARAIKAEDPTARIMGPASANTWFWWACGNLERFLKVHGNKGGSGLADAISVHWYPDGGKDDNWTLRRSTAQEWQSAWDYIKKTIAKYDDRPLPLYITEWNWGASDKSSAAKTLANALGCADMVGMFMRTGVAGHTHFCLQRVDHGWGVFTLEKDYRPASSVSPTYFGLSLAARVGKTVLPVANPKSDATELSAYAGRDQAGGVQVMLINKTEAAMAVQVSFAAPTAPDATAAVDPKLKKPREAPQKPKAFDPDGKEVAIYTLVGASGTKVYDENIVYNDVADPKPGEADLPPPKNVKSGHALAVTLAPYSLTVIAFPGMNPQVKKAEVPKKAPVKRP